MRHVDPAKHHTRRPRGRETDVIVCAAENDQSAAEHRATGLEDTVRVLISADAEGVTGITSTNELPFGKVHYEFMREMTTEECNAAIAGAFDGGASEVVDDEAHWTVTNVLIDKLDPRADLIKGFLEHLCMAEGVQTADAVFFLGYHCRTGDSDGVANEMILGREIVEIRLNGRPVGESEINAAVCGDFGVPVVFAAGDDLYEKGAEGDAAGRRVCSDQVCARPVGGAAALVGA
jgi:D-amino peptidase